MLLSACDSDNGGLSFCGPCRLHDCSRDEVRCGSELATDGGAFVTQGEVARVSPDGVKVLAIVDVANPWNVSLQDAETFLETSGLINRSD